MRQGLKDKVADDYKKHKWGQGARIRGHWSPGNRENEQMDNSSGCSRSCEPLDLPFQVTCTKNLRCGEATRIVQEQARIETHVCLTPRPRPFNGNLHCLPLHPILLSVKLTAFGGSFHVALSTLWLLLAIRVCFLYTHPILSRTKGLCVALQASMWQMFNEEVAVVITKSVIYHLVFKSADNFPL